MDKIKLQAKKLLKLSRMIDEIVSKQKLTSKDKKKIIELLVMSEVTRKSLVEGMYIKNGKKLNARSRILEYLKSNVGKVVSGRELAQVAGISEFARRIRELRYEHGGWQISTGMNRSDLRPDEYVLESLETLPEYKRMDAKIWLEVLERDEFTCQHCGWHKGDPQTNRRKFLEVHHKKSVKSKGKPKPENLITLCNVCHDALESEKNHGQSRGGH